MELSNGGRPHFDDVPHIILAYGRYYIVDGHTRIVMAVLNKTPRIHCRCYPLGALEKIA